MDQTAGYMDILGRILGGSSGAGSRYKPARQEPDSGSVGAGLGDLRTRGWALAGRGTKPFVIPKMQLHCSIHQRSLMFAVDGPTSYAYGPTRNSMLID
jgi:hypothetical protein